MLDDNNLRMKNDIKVLAYYLPQFHPIKENDEWWGKGFTEWTNVAKAKPLYWGHYQPKIPADLGFYDLRLPEVREEQADYAKRAGISAFCYWHYWFGNGKRLLNYPFDEVVRLKTPEFPFCLAWANHSWYKKSWSSNKEIFKKKDSQLLIEQRYLGDEDYKLHFYTMLRAFKDDRYFKIHGKLVFVIFSPETFPDINHFMDVWQELALKESLPGFFFIGHVININYLQEIKHLNLDAINVSLHRHVQPIRDKYTGMIKWINIIRDKYSFRPQIIDYKNAIKHLDSPIFEETNIYPTLIPNWDHTPRSGRFGRVFKNCTPLLFGEHCKMIFDRIKNKKAEDQIVFLKSWNEWGEGNYMEPDLKYGTGYIDTLGKIIRTYNEYN